VPLDTGAISEDISYAWYVAAAIPQHPASGGTLPMAGNEEKS
jgi:Ni,Fe-hydrogenase I large subunit